MLIDHGSEINLMSKEFYRKKLNSRWWFYPKWLHARRGGVKSALVEAM